MRTRPEPLAFRALDHVTGRLNSLKGTLAECGLVLDQPESGSVPTGDVEAIRGKVIRQALIILAEPRHGVLQSGDARRALEAAGVVSAPMPSNKLWKQIALVRRFKQVSRGTYKLLPVEPETEELF